MSLMLFLLLVVGGGLTIGLINQPGDWYARLHKPLFNPPAWLFPPMWTILYVFIAISGWIVHNHADDHIAMIMWICQLILNFSWSPIVFRFHSLSMGLAVIFLLDIVVTATIYVDWPIDHKATLLLVPYLVWILFASLLNLSLLTLNQRRRNMA